MRDYTFTFHQGSPVCVTQYQFECAIEYLDRLEDTQGLMELLEMKVTSDLFKELRGDINEN